jgi:hypothetical protein
VSTIEFREQAAWMQRQGRQIVTLICTFDAASIVEQYPWLEDTGVIEVLIPKKEQVHVGKW